MYVFSSISKVEAKQKKLSQAITATSRSHPQAKLLRQKRERKEAERAAERELAEMERKKASEVQAWAGV